MIPRQAVQFEYPRPSYYGGLLTVYPIVTKDQQYGLFYETQVAWYGADSGIWGKGGHGPDAWLDKPVYNGEVWTIQREAKPGYYVTPQHLESLGQSSAYWDSEGIGDWLMTDGYQSNGYAPYG